ncbi:MAG: STAS domain-containing protein [Parachlamydiaceae bacterium]
MTTNSVINFTEDRKGDVIVFRIKGRLDALSSPSVEKKIFESINDGHEKILIDLANVSYLSSAGMRMFLSTTKKLRSLSGRLLVCGTTTSVLDVFKMSGFDHVLELFATEEEALRNVS